ADERWGRRPLDQADEQHEHHQAEERGLGNHRHADVERHRSNPKDTPATFGSVAMRGVVAVSMVPTAIHGATPKITSVAVRMPSAAHSGPCASGRCAKCGSGLCVLQKICFVT